MQTIVHRTLRALSGAAALYLGWRAVAPPFGAHGAAPLTRFLLAVLATVLLVAALTRTGRTSAGTRRRWRSHSPIRSSPARHATARISSRSSVSPVLNAHMVRAHPERVIVLCDGTRDGDAACRLAQSFAEHNRAAVRALALFPVAAARRPATSLDVPGPIEGFLDDVNAQLSRTTSNPGMWQLTLIVHDLAGELRRTCAEFDPDTIILPSRMCSKDGSVMHSVSTVVSGAGTATYAATPVLCVVGSDTAPTRLTAASPRADARTLAVFSAGGTTRGLT